MKILEQAGVLCACKNINLQKQLDSTSMTAYVRKFSQKKLNQAL